MLSRKPVILVVEDYEDSRAMLVVFLQMKGYDVIEAADARHITELARTALPDLILLDLHLPVVDGWQATASLKADLLMPSPRSIRLRGEVFVTYRN